MTSQAPEFVESFLGIFAGSAGPVDLGALGAMGAVSFGLYLPGGLLFGIALFRARVLPRWAALTLVLAALSTLLVPVLPHSVGRYAAVPFGVALAWLGWSLWIERPTTATAPSTDTKAARIDVAAAERQT